VAVLIGIIAALVTAVVVKAGGSSTSSAIVRGGIAFAGAVTLVILIEASLEEQ
jgi:hypothetical protein